MTLSGSVGTLLGLFRYNRLGHKTGNPILRSRGLFCNNTRFYHPRNTQKLAYRLVAQQSCKVVCPERYNVWLSRWLYGHSKCSNSLVIRTFCSSTSSNRNDKDRKRETFRSRTTLNYILATIVLSGALAFAFVPFYQIFCQVMGLGGQATRGHDSSVVESMKPIKSRPLVVKFDSNVNSTMRWEFYPLQSKMTVYPGETALAFYRAKNPTDKPIVGIATYNILPFAAAVHFNKIQCFCFEEQMLQPHEEVDMPVFFYIDPEFDNDHNMELVTELCLYYTFFEAKPGLKLPQPGELWPKRF